MGFDISRGLTALGTPSYLYNNYWTQQLQQLMQQQQVQLAQQPMTTLLQQQLQQQHQPQQHQQQGQQLSVTVESYVPSVSSAGTVPIESGASSDAHNNPTAAAATTTTTAATTATTSQPGAVKFSPSSASVQSYQPIPQGHLGYQAPPTSQNQQL
ncbi:hypothetical protein ElyMa_005191700 [Elysia marginata]|uniref:Uncharacterized protein n=1 Tax=Elysia marginata TaxID=1093978 RepID=A0AAV4JVJ2_9GAST|nr:hypothetical protein ElyMa_005191700 [Elysia marginata]